jgi:C1A family cysteine protease
MKSFITATATATALLVVGVSCTHGEAVDNSPARTVGGLVMPANLDASTYARPVITEQDIMGFVEDEQDEDNSTGGRRLRKRKGGIPKKLDLVKRGLVGPVKNQGKCGSCWAFSTTGVLEGAVAKKTGSIPSFSEQQFVSCSTANNGCNGGFPLHAVDQLIETQSALCTESEYTYAGPTFVGSENGTCVMDSTWVGNVTFSDKQCKDDKLETMLSGMEVLYVSETSMNITDELIMGALNKYGPISMSYYAAGAGQHLKKGEILTSAACYAGHDTIPSNDHAVLLVGYGVDKSSGKKYWKVKNSWGTDWNDGGYFMMERNNESTCGMYQALLALDVK